MKWEERTQTDRGKKIRNREEGGGGGQGTGGGG